MNNIDSVVNEEIVFYCKGKCKKQVFTTVLSDSNIGCPECGYRPDISPKTKAVAISQDGRSRRVYANNISQFAGESIIYHCKDCKNKVVSVVKPDEDLTCPHCRCKPDIRPESKAVTLSQAARIKRVSEFFKVGGEADRYLIDSAERHNDVYNKRLSQAEKRSLYYSSNELRKCLDRVADYILSGKSEDKTDCSAYSEDEFERKQSGGRYSVEFFCQIDFLHEDKTKTPADVTERESFSKGFSEPYEDQSLAEIAFVESVTDPVDKKIVRMLAQGYCKSDVAEELNLTEQRLRTRLKYIGEELTSPQKPKSDISKACTVCGEVKSIDDFGHDSRRKDGRQGICRVCDAKRKKNKKVTGLSTISA